MSVASELTRIQGAKADIKAAIEAKGISVPSSALLDEYAPYIEAIEGGGSAGFTKGLSSKYNTSAANSIAFTGLSGEPKAFVVTVYDPGGAGAKVVAVVGDSTGLHGVYNTGSQHNYSAGFTKSYSNGTLTVTAPTGVTYAEETSYALVYYYGSGTLTFKTTTFAPGSGVTAATFTGTGLTEIPAMYAAFLETAVNNESYRRVACYTNSSYDVDEEEQRSLGATFFSNNAPADTTSSFSVSYNNGLYINSGGTNAGGYFHNPGTYTLYYLMASDIGGQSGPNLQNKTVSPTTSQQSVTADDGYDGLGTVTVNAIQTETKTATPSTSQQTINATSGRYMTSVTVSAVTSAIDSDIVAGNIKSGVNILGVTGTYTGGGSATVATTTKAVGTSNVSSLAFTVSGQPKMFAVQLSLNSSGSYLTNSSTSTYLVSAVISDGTNVYTTANRYNSSGTRAAREYYYTTGSFSYANGTLTVNAGNGYFAANQTYRLIYIY